MSSLAYAAILDICAQSGLCFMLANILVVGGCDVGVMWVCLLLWQLHDVKNCDWTGRVTSKHNFKSGI